MAEVSEKQVEKLHNMPIVEVRITKSKDGQFVIHRTIITDIKPINYYKAVLEGSPKEEKEE